MNYFTNFQFKELFPNCSNNEILSCINCNGVDSLLYLLEFLQGFREFVCVPIRITSTFRDVLHNHNVGGSSTSQHLIGQAIDFKPVDFDFSSFVLRFQDFLNRSTLSRYIGQVFIYDSFIHIGLRTNGHKNLHVYDKRTSEKSN